MQLLRRRSETPILTGACLLALLLPSIWMRSFWRSYFHEAPPQSWDGSGHFAMLAVYNRSIFPDVFGWTANYFGGMPFPNFYPPLWYWLASGLHHLGVPLYLGAKLLVFTSEAAIPLALAVLAWTVSGRRSTTLGTVLLSLFPLLDRRLLPHFPGGLTFVSTFAEGIYTEPLGFVCMTLAVAAMLQPWRSQRLAAGQVALLSFTLLANFFAFVSLLPFIAAAVALPWREGLRLRVVWWTGMLALSCCLTAFWTIPVLTHYSSFATLALRPPIKEVVPEVMWFWFELGAVSSIWCYRACQRPMKIFLIGLALLAVFAACTGLPVTRNLPLQLPRLVAILALLTTIPMAHVGATLIRGLLDSFKDCRNTWAIASCAFGSIGVVTLLLSPSLVNPSLYKDEPSEHELAALLQFGASHMQGRYLVVLPHSHAERYEARSVSSYLGAQGNEVATSVFREASPSSLFYIPLQNAFSGVPAAFGISSSLANDTDFLEESWSAKLAQAKELGVRYAVVPSSEAPPFADLVAKTEHWNVFDLGPAQPQTVALPYLPALVVGTGSVKERRSGDFDFTRLAEEQFRSADFTVRLVSASFHALDGDLDLNEFGTLVFSSCPNGLTRREIQSVRSFERNRMTLIVDDGSISCKNLTESLGSSAKPILLHKMMPNTWLDGRGEMRLGNAEPARIWDLLRHEMNAHKVSTPTQAGLLGIPYLVRTTYNSDWRREDGKPLYLAAPSFMLTFSSAPPKPTFKRSRVEEGAVFVSGISTIVMALIMLKRRSA